MRRFDNLEPVYHAPSVREMTDAQSRALEALFDADIQLSDIADRAGVPISQLRRWFGQEDFQIEIQTRLRAGMTTAFAPVLKALVDGCQRRSRSQPMFIKIFFAQFNALHGLRTGSQQNVFFNVGGGGGAADTPQLLAPEALAALSVDAKRAYLAALDTIADISIAAGVVEVHEVQPSAPRPGVSLFPTEPGELED